MSLVTKLEQGGTPEVRIYKRGNDDINLDAFVRLSEKGFELWLDTINIKDKYKSEVRSAYQDMITRINENPESIKAKVGGGFTTTTGITNKQDGFDSYGVAANYLGQVLRNMNVYTKPESKQSNKSKYKRNEEVITSEMQNLMLGEDPNNFIRLDDDSYNSTTGQRNSTNRMRHIVTKLLDYRNNLKEYRDFDSDDDYNHAVGRIDSVLSTLLNDNPNDDWFALGQLGMTNLNDFLITGRETRTTPLTLEEQAALTSATSATSELSDSQLASKFEEWVSQMYPQYTGDLKQSIYVKQHIIDTKNKKNIINQNTKNDLIKRIGTLSNNDLKKWMWEYINNSDLYKFGSSQFARRLYGKPVDINNAYFLVNLVNQIYQRGLLHGFGDGSNRFYIEGTRSGSKNTAFVFNGNDLTITEMSIHEIPYFLNMIINEFNNLKESNFKNPYFSKIYSKKFKEGGIVKANGGSSTSNFYVPVQKPDKPDMTLLTYNEVPRGLYDWVKLNYGTNNGKDIMLDDILPGWKGSDSSKRPATLGKPPIAPTVEHAYNLQRNYIKSGSMLNDVRTAYLNWLKNNATGSYLDFINYYNNKVDAIRAASLTKYAKGYNNTEFKQLHDDYNELYSSSAKEYNPEKGFLGTSDKDGIDKILGSTMFNRNALAFKDNEDSKDLRLGTFKDGDTDLFWINNNGKLELRKAKKLDDGDGGGGDSVLEEKNITLSDLDAKPDNTDAILSLTTNLLESAKLIDATLTNNKIAKTLNESLKVPYLDSPELYSPVTGAFSKLQLRQKQAAEILAKASKPLTSDAELHSARMFEAQNIANNIIDQGNIEDDAEIKRTLTEALKRQETNTINRVDTANKNRAAQAANELAKAQTNAMAMKSNLESRTEFANSAIIAIDLLFDKYRLKHQNNVLTEEQLNADQVKNNALEKLTNAYKLYVTKPGNESKTEADFDVATKGAYNRAKQAIMNDYKMSLIRAQRKASVQAFKLPKGYTRYNPAFYDLSTYKNGGVLNANQIIDKIIRKNNENNS